LADIDFVVKTSRSAAEVRRTIEAELATRLPGGRIKRFWEGDVFRLVGMGADGGIEIAPGEIHVRVALKDPLSFMKGKVEQGLRETVERAATGASSPAAPAPQPSLADEGLPPAELEELRARLDGVVLPGPQAHDEFLTNFGHLHHWRPRLVVKPVSAEDVVETLRFAKRHGLTVSTRGAAHSQSELAISRGGILLDMKSFGRILEVDEKGLTATVEPGAIWRDVVARVGRHGLIPPVLTNNLSVTVGGTLSVAGIGVASFKYGAQTDNVEELHVATVDGEVHRCSRSEKADLFWGVLSGLGQVAIILKARLRLRRAKPMTRTYYLLYDDHRRFMEDAKRAMESGRWDYLESWCSPNVQGLKWVNGVRQPFAKWFFPFHLTVEFEPGREPDAAALLEGLRPYDTLHVDDLPTQEFANRLVPVFDVWKKLGTWEHDHPWMEVVLPYSTAAEYLDAILPDLSPGVNVGGHVLLWPARSSVSEVRLFMHPEEEFLVGFGILPAIPPRLWEQARPRLAAASELSIAMGGKRYLSGYVTFDGPRWREHFGPRWDELVRLKKQYDPEGRLNPGFVVYD
jgi:FAD/FMN-containing dehydrogenase